MSWQLINQILSRAMIDSTFADRLLKEPQRALESYGIELPPDEMTILCTCQAQSLAELSQQLIEKLGPKTLQEK